MLRNRASLALQHIRQMPAAEVADGQARARARDLPHDQPQALRATSGLALRVTVGDERLDLDAHSVQRHGDRGRTADVCGRHFCESRCPLGRWRPPVASACLRDEWARPCRRVIARLLDPPPRRVHPAARRVGRRAPGLVQLVGTRRGKRRPVSSCGKAGASSRTGAGDLASDATGGEGARSAAGMGWRRPRVVCPDQDNPDRPQIAC